MRLRVRGFDPLPFRCLVSWKRPLSSCDTHEPLSSDSVYWYRSKGSDALRLQVVIAGLMASHWPCITDLNGSSMELIHLQAQLEA